MSKDCAPPRGARARFAARAGLVVAGVWAVAAPVHADRWYEHYLRAEEALREEKWAKSVEELNEALERKGDSGARERSYGMNVISYFPYLKLGVAYFHLGQFDAALQAFETEEELGAVADSQEHLDELRRYRLRAQQAREQATAEQAERVATIRRESLGAARRLAQEGRLDDAVEALSRAAAVAPEDPEVAGLMAALQGDAAAARQRQEAQVQASRIVSDGKAALEAGVFAQAASLFQQALALRPDPETEALLRRAQAGMRSALEARRPPDASVADVGASLAEVRNLVSSGRVADALASLQPVLVIHPNNGEALDLLRQLLAAKRAQEQGDAVRAALALAESEFSAGRYAASLSAANRALALESDNRVARDYVRRAYREMSRLLLGSPRMGNIPPAIRFADFREAQLDGSRAQVVREADFRLSGVVIDNSAVDVAFLDEHGRGLEGTSTSQAVGDWVVTEFTLRRRVPPGSSLVRLVAKDVEGLASSAEYEISYKRPVSSSPWFAAGMAALPLLGVGGVVGYRLHRRKRLARRGFNPYVAGAPVTDERLFFGREKLIERVLQTIHNNSLLLHGERRIGKTSIQHHLKRRLQVVDDPEFVFFPVFVDLQGTREERFFATLMEEILEELGERIGQDAPGSPVSRGGEYGHREFVADLRVVLAALQGRNSKRVKLVLLLDEVDELNAYDPRINQRLRSLFMRSFAESLVAVVSGVEIRKQWEKEGSPWYNFFEEIEISAIDREAAEELITHPIRGVFEVEPGVVDRIIELSQCKPFRIQRLCVALVNRLHEEGRRRITLSDVEDWAKVGEA